MSAITRFGFRERIHLGVVHSGTLYLTGQVGTAGDSVADQTRDALAKVDSLLVETGTTRDHLLQATIWLDDMRDFAEFNAVWDLWVSKPNAPARSTGQVRMNQGIKVEITAIAATPGS